MRALLRNRAARTAGALLVAGVLTLAARAAGAAVVLGVLFCALGVIAFAALTIAPDAIAHLRGHSWRWWWRASDDEGPFWPGTRVPRHPRPAPGGVGAARHPGD